jgi:hypothetical protein
VLAVPLRFVIMVVMSFSDIDGENKEQGENHQHVSSTMEVHRTHALLIFKLLFIVLIECDRDLLLI